MLGNMNSMVDISNINDISKFLVKGLFIKSETSSITATGKTIVDNNISSMLGVWNMLNTMNRRSVGSNMPA